VTAARLASLIALAGILPILLLGGIAIEVLRRSGEREAEAQLGAVASLAAARIDDHLAGVLETLRAVAGSVGPEEDAARSLAGARLGAPSLRWLELVGPPPAAVRASTRLTPEQVAAARGGAEQISGVHLASDVTPAVDACVPARRIPGYAVCAGVDLSVLWRHARSIHVGQRSGWVLIFDGDGRLLASGLEALRGAALGGARVAESSAAARAARNPAAAPARFRSGGGEDVLAGWARLDRLGWMVVVERPAGEALRPVRRARLLLAAISAVALALSVAVGTRQSRRLLGELAAEERWRTAGRIATGVTHDLNHRLVALQHAVKLAERLDPEVLPRLRDLLRVEVGALRGFVDDFADLSREAIAAELRPVDLAELLRSVALTGESYAEHMGVRLAVDAPATLPATADRHLLERALLNLVTNAVEASPRGAEVLLRAQVQGGRALLQVRDQGSGISPERVARIFDAFSSTKRSGGHLGLGLASVKRVAEAHRGQVRVDSRPGEGATFTVELPAGAERPRA
jgi:signal transduction histidine kinase